MLNKNFKSISFISENMENKSYLIKGEVKYQIKFFYDIKKSNDKLKNFRMSALWT